MSLARVNTSEAVRRRIHAQIERMRQDDPILLVPGPDSQALFLNIKGIGKVLVIEGAQGPPGSLGKKTGPQGPQGIEGLPGDSPTDESLIKLIKEVLRGLGYSKRRDNSS